MSHQPALALPGRTNNASEETYHVTVVYGSTSIASTRGKHIVATRPGTGQVKLALPQAYRKRVSFKAAWGKCAAGAVLFPVVLTSAVDDAADPRLVIETRTEAGTATDPASGNELDITIVLSRDSAND